MILDCSYRLPGPLACKILQENGYEVIKIEHDCKRDPFFSSSFNGSRTWYQRFNNTKQTKTFNEVQFGKFLQGNHQIIKAAIIDEPSPFLNILKKFSIKLIIISSSKEKKRPVHDLDILAKSTYFTRDTSIPEVPFVGILFAQKIVSELYKTLLKSRNETFVYLDDLSHLLNLVSLDESNRFFAGQVLGYNKYKIKDGTLFLTALETKSWSEFLNYIGLENKDNVHPGDSVQLSFYSDLMDKLQNMTKNCFSTYEESRQCFTIIETHHIE